MNAVLASVRFGNNLSFVNLQIMPTSILPVPHTMTDEESEILKHSYVGWEDHGNVVSHRRAWRCKLYTAEAKLENLLVITYFQASYRSITCKVRHIYHHHRKKTHTCILWQSKTFLEMHVLAGSKEGVEWFLILSCPFTSQLPRPGEGYKVSQYPCSES